MDDFIAAKTRLAWKTLILNIIVGSMPSIYQKSYFDSNSFREFLLKQNENIFYI